MYYTAAWDWRRDLWAEAPRILRALRKVHEMTGCKAIMAGHSFGGRMLYTVLAVRDQHDQHVFIYISEQAIHEQQSSRGAVVWAPVATCTMYTCCLWECPGWSAEARAPRGWCDS